MLKPVVVKVGGSALADPGWLASFADAVRRSVRPVVIVHGGGPEISELASRLDVGVTFEGGRRVTTAEMMDVVSMVLTGRINKRIVSALMDAGVDAAGLSGEDGGLLVASEAEGGALGRVGRVDQVRTELVTMWLERGITPVISPVSRGPDSAALNVNADEAAAAVACALEAVELVFLTDVDGVRDGDEVRPILTLSDVANLIDTGAARDGMIVKLTAARSALHAGVDVVRIGPLPALYEVGVGTRVLSDAHGDTAPAAGTQAAA